MKNMRTNIYTIQKNPSNIKDALNRIQYSRENILFTNCTSYLKVGNVKFKVQFDTALFSEENEMLILLIHGGELTSEDLKQQLEERNIPFHEVSFDIKEYKDLEEEKEIWFARDGEFLDDAASNSKRKGYDLCTFYPTVKGKFDIQYNTDLEGTVALDRQEIRGIVEFDDKIILLINHVEDCNVYYKKALKILANRGIAVTMDQPENWNKKHEEKQYKKER